MPLPSYYKIPEEKKEQIREATYKLFQNRNYNDINILEITATAKVPVGSFYRYFTDKDDLYLFTYFELHKKIVKIFIEKYGWEPLGDADLWDVDISDDIPQYQLDFYDSWYSVPDEVLYKFYFHTYDSSLMESYKEYFDELYSNGCFENGIDVDFARYLFTTTSFNIFMYCKQQKITNPIEIVKLKDFYFRKIFRKGLFKGLE